MVEKKKICIAGPIFTEDLFGKIKNYPKGEFGAPILSKIINSFAKKNIYKICAVTLSNDVTKIVKKKKNNIEIIYCPLRKHAYRFNGKYLGRTFDFFNREIKFILKAYTIFKPDFIFSNWSYEYSYAALKSKLNYAIVNRDIPHVVLKYNFSLYRLVRFIMGTINLSNAKNIITASKYAKYETQKYTDGKITIIPNPVDNFIPKKNIKNFKKIKKILMINNGFDRRKNIKIAIKTFLKLSEEIKNLTLHLYGNSSEFQGPIYNWCVKKKFNINNIFFNGRVNSKILKSKISNYDLFLSTSREETFGNVFFECMSAGIPIIAGNNSGASRELLKGKAKLVNINNQKEIHIALKKHIKDVDYWKKQRKKGLLFSKKFNLAKIINEYEVYISKIINNGKKKN